VGHELDYDEQWQAWYDTVREVFPNETTMLPDLDLVKMVEKIEHSGFYVNPKRMKVKPLTLDSFFGNSEGK